jgi:putative hemolysin
MPSPSSPLAPRIPVPIPDALLERVSRLNELRDLWRRAMARPAGSIHEKVIAELELRPDYRGAIDDIPAHGPLIIVANHPFGIVEGPVLGALLERIRPDILFVTNSLLAELPELRPQLIAVDPFGDAAHANSAPVRTSFRHLQRGGALVIFPAGQVSSLHPPLGRVQDADWQPMAARLALKTGAPVVPVFFDGHNGPAFQLAGLIHPALRTLLLPAQMLAKRRRSVRLVVGKPLSVSRFTDPVRLTAFLRSRTYSLALRTRHAAVAPPLPADPLRSEIASLSPILSSGPFDVFLEPAPRIPVALREIGRLRELTFRAAGEGSGQPLDLDRFDAHYSHLFVWHREHREIAGAYRLADCATLPANPGPYSATLFHFPRSWHSLSSQSVELGRSFVRDNYQRDFLPLLLLWKGIGVFVMRHPHIRYLFGPVSVSADYTAASRSAIASFFSPFRKGFLPRNPLTHTLSWRRGASRPASLDDLDALLRQWEPDAKGLPVLLRHYLSLNGEILCFNIDPGFANALDGLVLLDLARTPPRLLARYFGQPAVDRFHPPIPV